MSKFSPPDAYMRLCKALHVETQIGLASKLKIKQPSISSACARGSVPKQWLLKAKKLYNINTLWITEGKEPIYLPFEPSGTTNEYPVQEQEKTFGLAEMYASYASLTPVYSCHCDYLIHAQPPALILLESVQFPSNYIQEDTLVILYEASAFEPTIGKNAYVGINTTQTHVVAGEIHAIFMPLEGLTLKRIFPDPDHAGYRLAVDAKGHKDTYIPEEHLATRLLGRIAWTLHRV